VHGFTRPHGHQVLALIAVLRVGHVFGGFFADGGDPPMGRISVVGERGPELFVPKVPGTIISNEALRAGGRRQAVEVTVKTEPSPLFVQTVAVASQRAGQAAAADI
jgi:hypothetical protein